MKIVDENKKNANAYAAKITKLLNRKEALKIDPTDEATIKYYTTEELAEFQIDKINTVGSIQYILTLFFIGDRNLKTTT
jgi:hypothetical protein